ncbi:N-acetylmuramoyl-L-alanine amidase [Streptomyces sp. WAC 06738]|uniref:N-acetylmuramoyl-L-alanine amidase n=1 Tax=Streptomyces sp. WAC 06738 TaxID=2203210 RepID=UPI000F6F27B0|nr:N-acetylmuramoyl-L-alanine amidase [Streptomyces sp. WAC 06738]AZM44690.1 N-acetylmuramoyl-L-alanine amidase [Streptomyces sp. WAC 06738]
MPGRLARCAAATAVLLPLLAAGSPAAGSARSGAGGLQESFAAAARQYGVPESVLLGVAYLESRWDAHGGAPSVAGGYGPMHLTDLRAATGESGGRGTQTVQRAARLSGIPAARLRSDPGANVRGGAALLADHGRRLGAARAGGAAGWYPAVAAYAQAGDAATARVFADEVYAVLRAGVRRTTDSGETVTLPADASARTAARTAAAPAAHRAAPDVTDCPRELACEWLPAPYEVYDGKDGKPDYGNHDKARRPHDQRVRYIVVHDTEGGYDGSVRAVQDPEYVSWHYTLRSSDGHVAQHVRTGDVAWHAGNWQVNSQSIGLEHEARLTDPDAWFTEAMYRSSARLVRHLAQEYDVPLNRHHIIGHDNVPAPDPEHVPDMHTDPGPYWDWAHYFDLLGAPLEPAARTDGGIVTIRPDYAAHRPEYTACTKDAAAPCPPHGSGAVRLHTRPASGAPLVGDPGLHGDAPASTGVNDTGARASTGQQFAVAGRRGDWTAIWYLGRKAWFHNPAAAPTALPDDGATLSPRPGAGPVRVYGRALPEASAYPEGVEPEESRPLPYELRPGQRYAVGDTMPGEYFHAPGLTDETGTASRVIRGRTLWHQIQVGHRIGYVRAADVTVVRPRSDGQPNV